MWTSIYDYLRSKLFAKPVIGQKRKNEEWCEYPPIKQMKLDLRNRMDTEDSLHGVSKVNKGENYFEEPEECCIINEISKKKWVSPSIIARKSIHQLKFNKGFPVFSHKTKFESNSAREMFTESGSCDNEKEIEVVKVLPKNVTPNCGKAAKSKITSRIYRSDQSSKMTPDMDKSKAGTFHSSMKKSLNFLQESSHFSEKVLYMQLLQQRTTVLNSLLAPFTIQRSGSHKEVRPSVPLIDLTKQESNIVVDKSKENIPWISSWTKSNGKVTYLDSNQENRNVPKINTLQDVLKTHPVTKRDIIDEILSHHSTEIGEKRSQAEIEGAKLKALNASNRKAYAIALEEKIRNYMRITTPALEELEPEKDKYVLPELTEDQESKISSALMPSPAGEILVEKFGLQIKRRDLQTLKGLNWLNDEVINFYMNLIMERGKQENLPSVYAFNTFFYPKLLSGGHSSLKRWTKKVDIFSYDIILVPIHLEIHWCMAVIDFRSKEVRYYDSMGSPNNRCLEALLTYLEAESLDKRKIPYNTKDWEQINVEDIPQQMNGSDCGVFSCVFAEHIARGSLLNFSQEQMPYFRRKMTLEIIESKLLT